MDIGYRQFGGHKIRENKNLIIKNRISTSLLSALGCFGFLSMYVLPYKEYFFFALLDKKLFIYLMQNFRSFTYLLLRGVQRTLEELLNTPVRTGIKYL